MNMHFMQSQLPGAGLNATRNRDLANANAIPVRVSLEERLDYLRRGLERLIAVRGRVEYLADRLSNDGTGTPESPVTPSPSGLSSRFGETIDAFHTQVDALELLVGRITAACFDEKGMPPAAQPGAIVGRRT
jgi:hypothetical protein